MKLKSLNTVLAMTAALGIAFVGISCKPAPTPGDDKKGSAPAADAAKKDAAKKDAAPKEDAAPKADAPKKDAAPKAE